MAHPPQPDQHRPPPPSGRGKLITMVVASLVMAGVSVGAYVLVARASSPEGVANEVATLFAKASNSNGDEVSEDSFTSLMCAADLAEIHQRYQAIERARAQAKAANTTVEPNKSQLRFTISEVKVDGDRGTVTGQAVNTKDGKEDTSPVNAEVVREGGHWVVCKFFSRPR